MMSIASWIFKSFDKAALNSYRYLRWADMLLLLLAWEAVDRTLYLTVSKQVLILKSTHTTRLHAEADMLQLTCEAVDHTFASIEEKTELQQCLASFRMKKP